MKTLYTPTTAFSISQTINIQSRFFTHVHFTWMLHYDFEAINKSSTVGRRERCSAPSNNGISWWADFNARSKDFQRLYRSSVNSYSSIGFRCVTLCAFVGKIPNQSRSKPRQWAVTISLRTSSAAIALRDKIRSNTVPGDLSVINSVKLTQVGLTGGGKISWLAAIVASWSRFVRLHT
jgi:hypothetical protein